jgi:hypothetical protein
MAWKSWLDQSTRRVCCLTFSYYKAPDFPDLALNETVRAQQQLTLPIGVHVATTEMQYLGSAEGGVFERFAVEHQVDRKGEIIIGDERARQFIEVRRFAAYYHREHGYFLVQAGKKDTRGTFDRLKKASPPVVATVEPIDLALLTDLGTTTGAWFGKLKIADVNTAALFGPSGVLESEEWERYQEAGVIASVYMKVVAPNDDVQSIQLTKDRIVVLGIDEGERGNLEFVAHLQAAIDEHLEKG